MSGVSTTRSITSTDSQFDTLLQLQKSLEGSNTPSREESPEGSRSPKQVFYKGQWRHVVAMEGSPSSPAISSIAEGYLDSQRDTQEEKDLQYLQFVHGGPCRQEEVKNQDLQCLAAMRGGLFHRARQTQWELTEEQSWMLEVQDQTFLSPEKRKIDTLRDLLLSYELFSSSSAESRRFYVHLHVLNYEQTKYVLEHQKAIYLEKECSLNHLRPWKRKNAQDTLNNLQEECEQLEHSLSEAQQKTEIVFYHFMEKFPSDVLIWKILVLFLTKATYNVGKAKTTSLYNPPEIVTLLNAPNLKALRNLDWFQATIARLKKEKSDPDARPLPIILKRSVEKFSGNLDVWSGWSLEAENALTSVTSKTVQPAKAPFSFEISEAQLTPRKRKSLLNRLIRQFESSPPPSSEETRRLYLRLKIKISGKDLEKVRELFSRYSKDCLAQYYILSFLIDCKDVKSFWELCMPLSAKFPLLSWMDELKERANKKF